MSAVQSTVDSKERQRQRAETKRIIRELIRARRRPLFLGLLLLMISRLAAVVVPASSKWVVDEVIGRGRHELLLPIAIIGGLATVVQAASAFLNSQIISVAAQRAITEMRRSVHAHVMRLPVRYFDSTQTGVLLSRIIDNAEGIRNFVGTGFIQLVGSILSAALGLGVLLYLNWALTVITTTVLLLYGVAMAYVFRRMVSLFHERYALRASVTGRLAQALAGIRVVKCYSAEAREGIVFAEGADGMVRNAVNSIVASAATTAGGTTVMGIVTVLLVWIGGADVLSGKMTLGDFFVYILFTWLVAEPIVATASIGTQIAEAVGGIDHISQILATDTEDDLAKGSGESSPIAGDIRFDDVWFEYQEGRPVLKGLSFHAPPGTTTAVVGSSGSGKSTLLGLLTAFHRPTGGRILIDGRDLATIPLRAYRGQLAAVLQDNFLFDGTVAENISYGSPRAGRDEVTRAAQAAHCEEFILALPDGYETVVGERGIKLSGGQQQRVSIARAILADPRVLLLDEATASLDSQCEQMVQDGLRRLYAGRTTFVIAHRLSTIRSADQILVLEGGRIVECGMHLELIAKGGRYRHLYDKQYRREAEAVAATSQVAS